MKRKYAKKQTQPPQKFAQRYFEQQARDGHVVKTGSIFYCHLAPDGFKTFCPLPGVCCLDPKTHHV